MRRDLLLLSEMCDAVRAIGDLVADGGVEEIEVDSTLSYVDATGNMRIAVDAPVIFISDRDEDRDPWRRGRPRGTLKGEPAARVARALLDYDRDWTVRELIAASGASTGAAYRALEYLEREDLVVKEDKRYRVTDWERLLRAWSSDVSFQTTTRVMAFRPVGPTAPRGGAERDPLGAQHSRGRPIPKHRVGRRWLPGGGPRAGGGRPVERTRTRTCRRRLSDRVDEGRREELAS